jgi:hypothetical protein
MAEMSWAGVIQSVCAVVFLLVGLGFILSDGIIGTMASLTSTTSATGFTLVGLGIAIGSFAVADKNQAEILERLPPQTR